MTSHGAMHFQRAKRIVGDSAVAEDVCQQAYLKAMNAQSQIHDPRKLPGWLNRVIVNESLDVLRTRKRQRRAYEGRGEVCGETMTGDNSAQQTEEREHLMQLLQRLDEPVRTVVVMRTMQGMTGNEVKQALGCSAALVSKRLHHGLDQLRRWMDETPLEKVTSS
ncbi:MAG: sigma-70 family RNA polymerase sigma factor [Planctomycetota bacterium]